MKPIKFKFLLLLAIMAFAFTPFVDASIIQPATHFIQSLSPGDMGLSVATLAVVPIALYVKQNTTITTELIQELTEKYGKIKIVTVVVEPPVYDAVGNITDTGEFYEFAFRRPDAGLIRMLTEYTQKGENQKYIDAVIKNLIVGGDKDKIESDGVVYLGVVSQIKDMMQPYEAFLSKA